MDAEEQQPKSFLKKPRKILGALTAIAGTCLAGYHAHKEHREENEASLVHWTKWTAFGTWAAVIIATCAAGLLYLQLGDNRDAIEEANRAWVAPDAPVFDGDPQIGKPLNVIFTFDNNGRDPGLDLKISTFFDVINQPLGKDMRNTERVGDEFCTRFPPTAIFGAAYPGIRNTNIIRNTRDQNIVWSEALETFQKLLRVRGCVSYMSFGKIRYSWFCNIFILGQPGDADRKTGASCNGGSGST